jgi:Family of unknown function (DUF6516)
MGGSCSMLLRFMLLEFLTTGFAVVIYSNMKAELLLHERHLIGEDVFVEIRIHRVPAPVHRSLHAFKYSLALVAKGVCVLRYDNEAGKGDHRHGQDGEETAYDFVSPAQLLADFWADVDQRRFG